MKTYIIIVLSTATLGKLIDSLLVMLSADELHEVAEFIGKFISFFIYALALIFICIL
jgi:hypothetical protein